MFPTTRMRRLRTSKFRSLISETTMDVKDLICPVFVDETITKPMEINSMPGYFRQPLSMIADEAASISDLGIPAIILFGIPEKKDETGSHAYGDNDVIQKAIRAIKSKVGGNLIVITDLCLCEYTSHGHCGMVSKTHEILNDPTLKILGKTAVSHARAGADMVAPSGMMDGMVGTIRSALDDNDFTDIPIMSYAAKYCSSFYGPFREAAGSGYAFGDRASYQMDPANTDEALREVELDIKEGADIIMVKPALPYLDIIYRVKKKFRMPTAAYHVSGEYSMIKAAAGNGWLDEKKAVYESLVSIKRAGADMILTYFAKDVASELKSR
ncbi:MAG: porphobilinogen synthase [Candidatus Methanoperedens sp.]|nr:porphobilinogen synthase [Candidatus Methanoperedens sp.]MCZ7404142.1 porphobilinogen synthase [Candidatus Methanoperedens sp.]